MSDRRWRCARAAIVLAAELMLLAWLVRDRIPPSFDQSHYLDLSLRYIQALHGKGVPGLVREIYAADPARAPLLSILMALPMLALGPAPGNGLLLNLAITPVLLLSLGAIAARVADRRAGLVAMIVAATMPVIVGLSHNQLAEFLEMTLASVTVLLLLVAGDFKRTGPSLSVGVLLGLGLLCKVTFGIMLAGPLGVAAVTTAAAIGRNTRRPETRRLALAQAANVVAAGCLAAVMGAAWYVPALRPTLDYVQSATSGPLAIGTGPADPLTLSATTAFTLEVIEYHLSWLFAIALAVGLVAGLFMLAARWRKSRQAPSGPGLKVPLMIASWAAIPYLAILTGHNHDPRLISVGFPALAVIIGVLLSSLSMPQLRLAAVALVCAGGVAQALLTLLPRIPPLPDRPVFSTAVGPVTVPIDTAEVGYNRRPVPVDRSAPIMSYLETATAGRPVRVGMMQLHPVVNPNTFNYLADARRDPFIFSSPVESPGGAQAYDPQLRTLDFAIYIPDVHAATASDRLALLNQQSPAALLGDGLFALFPGPRKSFPIGDNLRAWVLAAGR